MLKHAKNVKTIQSAQNSKKISLLRRFLRLILQNPSIIKPVLKLEYTRNMRLYWWRRFNTGYAGTPANVGINLTRRCNLKCKMCMQNRHVTVDKAKLSWYDSGQELPLSAWVNLINEIAIYRPWVSVTGGEPLLYPDFTKVIQALKEKKLPIDLTTNGLLLKDIAEFLVEQRVEMIFVSVDGPEDVHDEIRGLKGAFQRTIAGIRALVEARAKQKGYGPVIAVNCTMTKSNLHIIDQMVSLAVSLNVELLQFIHPFFNTRANAEKHNRMFSPKWAKAKGLNLVPPSLPEGEYYESELSEDDLPIMIDGLEKARRQAKGRIALKVLPHLSYDLLHPYYLNMNYPFSQTCKALWTKCRVLPDGAVSPCLHVVAGNITEQPLLELWNGPQMSRLREIIAKRLFPACDRCCNKKF